MKRRKKPMVFNAVVKEKGKWKFKLIEPINEFEGIHPFITLDNEELKIIEIKNTKPRDFGDVKKIGEIEIKEDNI